MFDYYMHKLLVVLAFREKAAESQPNQAPLPSIPQLIACYSALDHWKCRHNAYTMCLTY